MNKWRLALLFVGLALPWTVQAQTACACDPAQPETMALRQCSLCREAEKQPEGTVTFFLKDINPRKPNRWLALPKTHSDNNHNLEELPKPLRTALWTAAMQKAQELFGDEWGLAYNGLSVRTQCHAHIHIGRLIPLPSLHNDRFVAVNGPADIPVRPGEGVWVHPVGKQLHVHYGEQTTETILFR